MITQMKAYKKSNNVKFSPEKYEGTKSLPNRSKIPAKNFLNVINFKKAISGKNFSYFLLSNLPRRSGL